MINVIATIEIKPGARPQFLALMNELVPTVLAEQGCVEYFPAVDVEANLDSQSKAENVVTMIEKWESLEALHAHLEAPHMNTFRENAADIIEGLTLKVLEKA
jgi:quinol monooxygenase YgiN